MKEQVALVKKARFWVILLTIFSLLLPFEVWAKAAPIAKSTSSSINNIRMSQSADAVRIVFDMSALPEYTVKMSENPAELTVIMTSAQNKSPQSKLTLNDPVVQSVTLIPLDKGDLQAVVNLKTNFYFYKVFTLKDPNRLIIDIVKNIEIKEENEIAPAVKYTSWQKQGTAGKIWAHILEIPPGSGYILEPVLAKGTIAGLESLSSMSERVKALALVNASYFNKDGTLIGLFKMNNTIISTSDIVRTATGIMPDGKIIIGQPKYTGKIEFFNKQTMTISAVNRERGPNELVLYNGWYDTSSKTNDYGLERTVINGKVTAESINNSHIPKNAAILSAHGQSAEILGQLKIGDDVKITETLGNEWDKTVYAIGAGPMLVKDKAVFLTTKIEEFGNDVAGGRAPRTAIGVREDGTILLVVVDGRQADSRGMTLLELALFMQELGAYNAMNLDGGGSSEMVVKDKIVNKPSDGRERKIGSAIAVVNRRLAH